MECKGGTNTRQGGFGTLRQQSVQCSSAVGQIWTGGAFGADVQHVSSENTWRIRDRSLLSTSTMVMPGQPVSWLKYSVCPKAIFCQVGQRLPTGGAPALENRREDSWRVFGGTVGAGFTVRRAMPCA